MSGSLTLTGTMVLLGQKKSPNISGQKNHPISQDKKTILQPFLDKGTKGQHRNKDTKGQHRNKGKKEQRNKGTKRQHRKKGKNGTKEQRDNTEKREKKNKGTKEQRKFE